MIKDFQDIDSSQREAQTHPSCRG